MVSRCEILHTDAKALRNYANTPIPHDFYIKGPNFMSTYQLPWVNTCLAKSLDNVLKVTAVVVTFDQEKALVAAFFMIIIQL